MIEIIYSYLFYEKKPVEVASKLIGYSEQNNLLTLPNQTKLTIGQAT